MTSSPLFLEFKTVDDNDIQFLYELLKERDPSINISHKQLPSYQDHTRFVSSNPYFVWNIIYYDSTKIGSIYLTNDDEIGIFIRKDIQGQGFGGIALEGFLKTYPRKKYKANINPMNYRSLEFFEKHGFKSIQVTFERNE